MTRTIIKSTAGELLESFGVISGQSANDTRLMKALHNIDILET